MMNLVDVPLGPEGHLNMKIDQGKLIVTASHKHASGQASVVIEESLIYQLDKVKTVIPGQVDDAIIDVAKVAIMAL